MPCRWYWTVNEPVNPSANKSANEFVAEPVNAPVNGLINGTVNAPVNEPVNNVVNHAEPPQNIVKILFVFAWLVVGGEETEVRLLARCLDAGKYRLSVISTYRRDNMPDQTHAQLRALGVDVDTRCYELPEHEHAPHIARRIREDGFDLVIACQGVRPVYPAYDLLAAQSFPAPPLIEHGGLVSEAFHNPKHHTSAYVGVCRAIRDAAASVMPGQNALEIPSMVDLSEFAPDARNAVRQEWNFGPDNVVIGWVGRLDAKKRVEDFIAACALVAQTRTNARFVIIGGPDAFMPHYADALKQQALDAGLKDRLLWTGDRPDVPRLLGGVDVFAWLSQGEGMPHVIAEAGAAGLPVIATRDGGTTEQITDEVSGLFVPHEHPASVAQAMTRLIDDPDLRARLGRALQVHVIAAYSANAIVPQWEQLFAGLLAAS